jgi:hypothetical protein
VRSRIISIKILKVRFYAVLFLICGSLLAHLELNVQVDFGQWQPSCIQRSL